MNIIITGHGWSGTKFLSKQLSYSRMFEVRHENPSDSEFLKLDGNLEARNYEDMLKNESILTISR